MMPEAVINDVWIDPRKISENSLYMENQKARFDSDRRRSFYVSSPHSDEEGAVAALSDEGYQDVLKRGVQLLNSPIGFQVNPLGESIVNKQNVNPVVSLTSTGYDNVVTLGQSLLYPPVIYTQASTTTNTIQNMPRVSHKENKIMANNSSVSKHSARPSRKYASRENKERRDRDVMLNPPTLVGKSKVEGDEIYRRQDYVTRGARPKQGFVEDNDNHAIMRNVQSDNFNQAGHYEPQVVSDFRRNRVVPNIYDPYIRPNLPTYEQVSNQRRPQKPVVMPDKFDGSIAWQDYQAHFDLCAELNAWSDIQKANYLAVSLRGAAQELLGDMSCDMRQNYQFLTGTLCARFGSEGQTELFRTQLKSRQRKSGESLPELAQSIRRLVSRAYPDATLGLREILSKDCFVDALLDSEIRLRLKQSKPTNLNETVKLAIELEAFQLAENEKCGKSKKFVRFTKSEGDQNQKDLLEKITELEKEVEKLKGFSGKGENFDSNKRTQYDKTNRQSNQGQQKKRYRDVECWNCGKKGHTQWYCKGEDNSSKTEPKTVKEDAPKKQEN